MRFNDGYDYPICSFCGYPAPLTDDDDDLCDLCYNNIPPNFLKDKEDKDTRTIILKNQNFNTNAIFDKLGCFDANL